MKYWVYINDKVVGPYEEGQLASLEGFSPDTLICADGGNQEWVKANSVFDFGTPNTSAASAVPETSAQATPSTTAQAAVDAAAVQVLIDKIDSLTKEIEGMKTKLDQTWQASAATQAAMEKMHTAPQVVQTPPSTEEPVVEDALITNTQSLVNHAEQIVAQAGTEKEEKPLDFLNEIHIGDEAASETTEDKNGEEVVLRSALDSMYGPKQEPEEEKESTFQDLLSPAKETVVTAAAAAAGVALTAAALGGTEQEATAEPVVAEPEVTQPKATEPEAVAPATTEPEVVAPITEEKREEIINEITAPAAEPEDALSQAIEEAQQAPASDVPTLENAELPQETAEKPSLELTEEPKLDLASIPEPTAESLPETQTAPEEQSAQEVPVLGEEEESHPAETQKVITQTAQELVPGKKLESAEKKAEDDELISQADLEEAFTERTSAQEFPFSEIQEESTSTEEKPQQSEAQSLPSGEGFYNPNDMTEVQLKEGSTYLISDFIPSANTGNTILNEKAGAGAAAAATGAAALAAIAAGTEQPSDKLTTEATITGESIEEIVPAKDKDDITMSKVILENTIRTKRGASMDIKTVPMVKEPADSERLDLTDSDLDINAQHDLKAADFKQPGSSLTKVILGTLVALVFAALIYVGLAYLDIIPAQFNVLKKVTATEPAQEEQLNEMLGPTDQQQAPQVEPEQSVQPAQMPSDVEDALTAAPATEENANPMDAILTEVKNFPMVNGQTLEQLINSRHPATEGLIEWSITTAVEPDNYSVLVKVPPENPQSFRITYRFNYNTVTKDLDPTISDSKNLLDSLKS